MLVKNIFLATGILAICFALETYAIEEFTFEDIHDGPEISWGVEIADTQQIQKKPTDAKKTPAPPHPPAAKPPAAKRIEVKPQVEKNIVLPASSIEKTIYMHPGMITYRDGKWIGGDHLFNVSKNIPIAIELILPQNAEVGFNEESIRAQVVEIFKKIDITSNFEFTAEKPPLPFFHLLIMVQPIEKGFVACCDGRLFEDVHLDRVVLDSRTAIQGITWEKQSLLVFPEKLIDDQIKTTVDDIATTFTTRFEAYEKLKNKRNAN